MKLIRTLAIAQLLLFGPLEYWCCAGTLAQHTGSNDPTTEGWEIANLPQPDLTVGPVMNDLGTGLDAWYINNNQPSFNPNLWYEHYFSTQDVLDANQYGWTYSVKMRVVDVPDNPDAGVWVFCSLRDHLFEPNQQPNRHPVLFEMFFGSQADGDPIVMLQTGGNTLPTIPIEGGDSGYHLYELRYNPAVKAADFYVDDSLQFGGYAGIQDPAMFDRVWFGTFGSTGGGQGNYNLVQFDIVPEPSAIALATLASAGLLACRMKHASAGRAARRS